MRCVGRSAGLPALQGCLPNLGLTQQLAASRRAAPPTLPREQRAPMMQQLAAECLPPSMSISNLWRLYSLHERLRLSELCASRRCVYYVKQRSQIGGCTAAEADLGPAVAAARAEGETDHFCRCS